MAHAPARFEKIAHRGAPTQRVENTIEGFLLALEQGADAVELDVHVTHDGVPIVHHDPVVRPRAGATATLTIATEEWQRLKDVDLGDGAVIPRLDDVLQAVGSRAAVYIELKGTRIEDVVIATARAHGSLYALHSFDHEAIARVAWSAAEVPRGILLDRGTKDVARRLRESVVTAGVRDVWPHWSLVTADVVAAAREMDVRVIAWTVNSSDAASALIGLGVDGICSDDVRILANL